MASTGIYTNQGEDWWYLASEAGQHVFFYSRRALGRVARKYGYDLLVSGGYLLFLRPGTFAACGARWPGSCSNRKHGGCTKAVLVMRSAEGVWQDLQRQVEQSKSARISRRRPRSPVADRSRGGALDSRSMSVHGKTFCVRLLSSGIAGHGRGVQHADRALCHLGDGLAGGRDRRGNDRRNGRVVEAHDGEIFRHVEMMAMRDRRSPRPPCRRCRR